jgi:hypothetical protein
MTLLRNYTNSGLKMFDEPITTIEQAKEFFQGMGYQYVTTPK